MNNGQARGMGRTIARWVGGVAPLWWAGWTLGAQMELTVSARAPLLVGDTVEVSLRVTNASAFATWGAFLTFDPGKLEFTGQWAGGEDVFIADSRTTSRINGAGQARLGGYALNDEPRPDALARVWFRATGTGVTEVASANRQDPALPFGNALYTLAGTRIALLPVMSVRLSIASNADGDRDGMPDAWEIWHFGRTNAPNGAAQADWDGDGMGNLDEYRAGTAPTNAASVLAFTALGAASGGGMVVQWQSASGRLYGIESTTNLSAGVYQPVAGGIPATPPMNVCTDAATSGPRKFYKVTIEN